VNKPGARPKHELSVILEAARLFPDNVQAAAEYAGVTYTTIDRYMTNAGLPIIPRRTKSPVAGYKKIDWNTASVAKLKALIDTKPRPSIDEIAAEMGCKRPAIYGIMSKLRLSFRDSGLEIRKCMCCERQFWSEGIGDRLCDECGNGTGEIGVTEYSIGVHND
jgi:hypothetical protein